MICFKESATLKQIISILRQRMLPPTINQFFFGYPDKAKIEILPVSPFPILECVLESMSVNYAPNGANFYGTLSSPVQVDITLNFKEIVIFNRDEAVKYDKEIAGSSATASSSTSSQPAIVSQHPQE